MAWSTDVNADNATNTDEGGLWLSPQMTPMQTMQLTRMKVGYIYTREVRIMIVAACFENGLDANAGLP